MSYPGGKGGAGVYQAIINQMPPHDTYIEPFLGAGSVMRMKRPAARTIGIDLDPAIAGTGDAAAPLLAAWGAEAAAIVEEIEIARADGIAWLRERQRWTGRELVYCDPPYLMAVRRHARALYAHEMAEADHRALLDVVKRLPCAVMLSGYPSALYLAELAAWRIVMFAAPTRGRPALEYLWCNFPPPAALHDYRYLGATWRERERIGRKVKRWRAKAAQLDPLERQAVLSGLLDAPAASPFPARRDLPPALDHPLAISRQRA